VHHDPRVVWQAIEIRFIAFGASWRGSRPARSQARSRRRSRPCALDLRVRLRTGTPDQSHAAAPPARCGSSQALVGGEDLFDELLAARACVTHQPPFLPNSRRRSAKSARISAAFFGGEIAGGSSATHDLRIRDDRACDRDALLLAPDISPGCGRRAAEPPPRAAPYGALAALGPAEPRSTAAAAPLLRRESTGIKLKNWKMKRRAGRANSRARPPTARSRRAPPPSRGPHSGRSRPASRSAASTCRPEGPIRATNFPRFDRERDRGRAPAPRRHRGGRPGRTSSS